MTEPEEKRSKTEEITTDEFVQTAIKNSGFEDHKNKEKIVEVLQTVLEKGISPKDAMGIDDDFMEEVYGHGYRLYQSGKYKDSLEAFRVLQILNPSDARFCRGIALCYQHLEDIDSAVQWYVSTAILEDSPEPYFQAVDCYLKDNAPVAAYIILGQILRTCGDRPEFSKQKERAEQMRQAIRDKFEEMGKQQKKEKQKE